MFAGAQPGILVADSPHDECSTVGRFDACLHGDFEDLSLEILVARVRTLDVHFGDLNFDIECVQLGELRFQSLQVGVPLCGDVHLSSHAVDWHVTLTH